MRYTMFAALALSLTLSGASPAPLKSSTSHSQASTTSHSQSSSRASDPTATPSQSQTTPTSSTQTHTGTSSDVSTNARYLITHADISQHQGDVIPAHNTTATIIQTIETFDILVQGTLPGALPVQCNATWIATLASPTSNPIGTQFSCSDPAVSALMLRQDSDPSIGWWIMVEFNNKVPEMWMQKDLGSQDAWTLTPGGMWVFNGMAYSGPMPTQDLATYLGRSPT